MKRIQKNEQAARDICSDTVLDMVAVTDKGFLRIHNLLSKARHYLHKAQANLSRPLLSFIILLVNYSRL